MRGHSDKWLQYAAANNCLHAEIRSPYLRVAHGADAAIGRQGRRRRATSSGSSDAGRLEPHSRADYVDVHGTDSGVRCSREADYGGPQSANVPEHAASARRRRVQLERPPDRSRLSLQHGDRQAGARRFESLRHRSKRLFFGVRRAAGRLWRVLDVQRSGTARTAADKKLLEYYLVSARQSGAALSAEKRKSFIALSNELTQLSSTWQETLNNDATTLNISAEQAQSLPADFVKAMTHNADGTYTVKVNESTVTPFLDNERDATARKAYYIAYNNRALSNVAVLENAIRVRYQLARLLGYESWAAYRLADRMAKTPQRVLTFERSLDAKLMPQAKRDLAGLAQLKAKDTGNPNAAIDPWDVTYYYNQLIKTKYSVDNEEIRQYFPVDVVVDRIMNLYHKILGVTFVKVPDPRFGRRT